MIRERLIARGSALDDKRGDDVVAVKSERGAGASELRVLCALCIIFVQCCVLCSVCCVLCVLCCLLCALCCVLCAKIFVQAICCVLFAVFRLCTSCVQAKHDLARATASYNLTLISHRTPCQLCPSYTGGRLRSVWLCNNVYMPKQYIHGKM